MWSQQIFVALVCVFLASQQVAAVVNNGQTAKVEESKKVISENIDVNKAGPDEGDAAGAGTESQANRREASLSLGDSFGGAPITVADDSYLPSGPSNVNLPVPVYGVPDAPTNNIVYPAPPPDLPPPVSGYGVPAISGTYGVPAAVNYLPPTVASYASPSVKFETVPLTPPKLLGGGRGGKPPRPLYGVPAKPLFTSKFPPKYPYKNVKPSSTYGPPSGYFKDNYSPSKFNVKFNNIFSGINTVGHSAFAGQAIHSNGGHAILTQHSVPSVTYTVPNGIYGAPNAVPQAHSTNLNLLHSNSQGVSNNYGAQDIRIEIVQGNSGHGDQSASTQYALPGSDVLGPAKPHYGPPQPSPHPQPPHPGAPAPPTPPDIKYDGWQPIPGLVSRAPATSYGLPHSGDHATVDANNDLIPPPLTHDNHYESSASYGTQSYGGLQTGVSDSYGAPLNTVTGSGGIVSSSGEEVHGQHLSHSGIVDIDIQHSGNSGKPIGIDIYPSGSGSLGGQAHSSASFELQIGGDTYGVPPLNSYSSTGPYPSSHAHNNVGTSSLGIGSLNLHGSHNSHSHNAYNSYKSHGYKGLSLSNSGRGLIPPSGIYGATSSGHHGTPLYNNAFHGPPLNALKINPPRHPVVHREPVPPGLFESITKQGSHKHSHGQSNHYGFSSSYLPPPVSDVPKPIRDYVPSLPSTLYSLPSAHSSVSFQNIAHGSSAAGILHDDANFNLDGAVSSALSSYNAPLNIVDGSYNLPQSQTHLHSNLGGEVVGLDLSHPTLTIDLTHNSHGKNSFGLQQDCGLQKVHSLPSLSYGVPSADSYTASLSSLTTNIGSGHQTNLLSAPQHYGPPKEVSYQVSESYGDSHHDYDLSTAHSQKVSSKAQINAIKSESQGKSYGKTVAESFGSNSELLQSQSIDLNNIPVQGALGSYTLQIQSADGSQGEVAHSQVLNEGLLQSILAAIEQPHKNNGQPIIQLQKSLEKQNFVTNDSIPAVVGKLADEQIEHSSAPVQYVVEPSNEVLTNVNEKSVQEQNAGDEDTGFPLVEDNAIALYFSNNQRSKKEIEQESKGKNESNEEVLRNSH